MRWMGSEGFENAEAAAILKKLKLGDVSATTISIQITAGRKAKDGKTARGPLPALARDEVRQLAALRPKPEKAPKAAAPEAAN